MKMQRLFMALLLLAMCTACKQEENSSPKADVVKVEETSAPIVKKNIYPLTGLPSGEKAEQRAFAVMINNHPAARPQSGLHQADLVYEVLSEGNITRFLAVYQSNQPAVIGPVRSAREYYVDLSTGYDAVFISHGWSPQAKETLEKGNNDYLNGLFYDGTLFWRATFRKAPHNSYISAENIKEGADLNGINLSKQPKPLPFTDAKETAEGDSGLEATVRYDQSEVWNSVYKYDKQTKKYLRYSNNEQTKDLESGNAIAVDNLFIAEMKHQTIDDYGRRAIDLTSGGKGILLQKGVSRQVEWRNIDGRILPYLNGKPIGFVPGKTWINIVPALENHVSLH
ncbi:DUF3048 domain-containing protein [Metabacillus idriensis]|uniref:DUF3048 domain-containing protein n=1 Tax=Metabacillus idriensis TaxID=324768 RepID=UPI003D2B0019